MTLLLDTSPAGQTSFSSLWPAPEIFHVLVKEGCEDLMTLY